MPSYPPIRVRVTLKINLPPLSEWGKEKIWAELPPIRVRVTLQFNLPPLSEGGQEKIYAELPPYPSDGNFKN
jgi:hypothetical protein